MIRPAPSETALSFFTSLIKMGCDPLHPFPHFCKGTGRTSGRKTPPSPPESPALRREELGGQGGGQHRRGWGGGQHRLGFDRDICVKTAPSPPRERSVGTILAPRMPGTRAPIRCRDRPRVPSTRIIPFISAPVGLTWDLCPSPFHPA